MKKILSIITAAALSLSLVGCRNNDKEKDTKPEHHDPVPVLGTNFDELISQYPDEITLPDGTTAPKSELVDKGVDRGYTPVFEFAFIRYAEPIFKTTMDEPNIVNPATKEMRGDIPQKVENPTWIKVKSGDILENGLKVTFAQTACSCFKDENGALITPLSSSEIKTEGEITLEGIFNYYNGGEAYGYGDYHYSFYPDSTKYKIPVRYDDSGDCVTISPYWLGDDNMIVSDGGSFYSFRYEDDLIPKFTENTVCKAKITYKNVVLGGNMSGEVVDADFDI